MIPVTLFLNLKRIASAFHQSSDHCVTKLTAHHDACSGPTRLAYRIRFLSAFLGPHLGGFLHLLWSGLVHLVTTKYLVNQLSRLARPHA
jgi:hypothetical protein